MTPGEVVLSPGTGYGNTAALEPLAVLPTQAQGFASLLLKSPPRNRPFFWHGFCLNQSPVDPGRPGYYWR